MCRSEAAGAYQIRQDKNGAPYYLHHLGDSARPSVVPRSQTAPPPERADPDTLHAVYSELLASLSLASESLQDLQRRGLTVVVIDTNRYRTLPVQGRAALARKLHERFGNTLLRVPGFGTKEGKSGTYLTIFGLAGLVVPVRDLAGRIVALKVRRSDAGAGPKYFYISSAANDGAGPGSPVHVPAGIQAPADIVRLTEGELKADVAFARSGLPTISVPGVANWRPALEVLKALGANTVRLAFDADAVSNIQVARPLLACTEALAEAGYAIELERWDVAAGKGIDDLLASGQVPEVLPGVASLAAVRDIAWQHFWQWWVPPPGDLKGARVILIAVGATNDSREEMARNLQTASLPDGWLGLTAKAADTPGSLAQFLEGKTAVLVRGTFDDPHHAPSEQLAGALLRAGTAEVRQICPGWGFFEKPHSTEEIAALLEKAEVFDPAVPDSIGRKPSDQDRTALDRLAATLEAGGAEAVFRDKAVLQALAQLALSDPAEYAASRVLLKRHKVSVRDLDRALQPIKVRLRAEQGMPFTAGEGVYRIADSRIVRQQLTPNGPVDVPLCNFTARIAEQRIHDDGADRQCFLALEGCAADGGALPRCEVAAAEFPRMDWTVTAWGVRAVVYAGQGTKDHLRCALQMLSADAPQRVVYGHLGWRKLGDGWHYLHAGGAIAAAGASAEVDVSAPPSLAGYCLPPPPDADDLVAAIRASLNLLTLGPDRLLFPILGAVYRCVLGGVDFSLHLAGLTGTCKTETAALAQQHFGPNLDARHLPGSWSSTGNALEILAFAAKDALLVVDDFCPTGSTADVQRYHREADRLFRAQGNAAGRGRLRSDASLRAPRPPRGLILSTGEDVPRGQSLRGRLLVLEFTAGEIERRRLSPFQADAAGGRYAAALAAFLHWLAPQYEAVRSRLKSEMGELRAKVLAEGLHARTPGIVAELALGWKYFLTFAQEAGAVSADQVAELKRRAWKALLQAAEEQAQHVQDADPAGQFLRLLGGALASGRAHLAGPDGLEPRTPEAWGWRGRAWTQRGGGEMATEITFTAQGRRIGWLDGEAVYLEPEAAYAEAQEMARQQGDSLPVSERTLWKRLKEKGLLASWDTKRTRNTVRRDLESVRHREVLHLAAHCLVAEQPSTSSTSAGLSAATSSSVNGSVDGPGGRSEPPVDRPPVEASTTNVHQIDENTPSGRCGQSMRGRDEQLAGKMINAGADEWGEL